MRSSLILAVAAAILMTGLAGGRSEGRPGDSTVAQARTIAYGADPLQRLDLWRSPGDDAEAPLVLFVHGGGWSRGSKDNATGRHKRGHYQRSGYAFASIDYRLVPGATVEQQAADVAGALREVLDRAGQLGIDPRRVVLMGHSAGAHLVALVGTDPRYLRGEGLSFADVAGVIPLDGAAYDVPSQVVAAGPYMKPTYVAAFGTEPDRQLALSPTRQAAAPNVARFLLLHVQRDDAARQTRDLAAALRVGGSSVRVEGLPGEGLRGHMEINRRMGDSDYVGTGVVDEWLRETFAELGPPAVEP